MDEEVRRLRRAVAQDGNSEDIARLLALVCRTEGRSVLEMTRRLVTDAYWADVHRIADACVAKGPVETRSIGAIGDIGNYCEFDRFPEWFRDLVYGTGRLLSASMMRETIAQAGMQPDEWIEEHSSFCKCDQFRKIRCIAFRAMARDVSRELDRRREHPDDQPPLGSRVVWIGDERDVGGGVVVSTFPGVLVRLDRPYGSGHFEWNALLEFHEQWRLVGDPPVT